MSPSLRRRQWLFRTLISIGGWLVVGAHLARLVQGSPSGVLGVTTLVLALTVIVTRLLASPVTRLGGVGRVSLDMALYVAGVATLGSDLVVPAVAVTLATDTFVRARQNGLPPSRAGLAAAYYGALTGGILGLFAPLFGFALPSSVDEPRQLVRLLGFGAFLLAVHYALQALDHLLSGDHKKRDVLRQVARGAALELLLLPLGAAIALVWEPNAPLGVGLLGITYALVNYGFRRISRQSSLLRRRIAELESLNRAGHRLAGSLERDEVVRTLLGQVAAVLPNVAAAELTTLGEDRAEAFRLTTDDATMHKRELLVAETDGIVAATVPVLGTDRIVVPLVVRDTPIGQLVVEGDELAHFSNDTLRLVDGLAVQGATALENARLYELANFDGLTGLYVRRYFDRRIAEETERARRFGTPFAVVMLDIDNFKQLNDTRGHLAGDRVLRAVALAATTHLRGIDLAARYGGEELAFLLPRTSLADAHAVAERIRARIEALALTDGDAAIRVTASLGVAAWSSSGADDPASLVGRADQALYRAKGLGKNRVEVDLASFEMTPSLAPVRIRVG